MDEANLVVEYIKTLAPTWEERDAIINSGSFLYCKYTFEDGYTVWRRGYPHDVLHGKETLCYHGFCMKVECADSRFTAWNREYTKGQYGKLVRVK